MTDPVNALEDLALRELKLLDRAEATVGLFEHKFELLRKTGAFAESAAVHKAYIGIAAPPSSSLEALKRAIFLGWYECAEPGCFTGIGDLDEAQHRRAHELLDVTYAEGRVDAEFAVMLGWYWSIADYYFRAYSPARLLEYVSQLEPDAYKRYGFVPASLQGRGQMGVYWLSIACRAG